MQGWQDVTYFNHWVDAVRAAELASRMSPGLVTRVIRKSHGFKPAPAPAPTPIREISEELPVDYIEAQDPSPEDEGWEDQKRQRRHQKKLARAASARARIPTWYDRISEEEDQDPPTSKTSDSR